MTPEQLQSLLTERGLSQSEAARRLEVAHSTVWRWLNGDMAIPPHREDSIRLRLDTTEVSE